MGLCRFRNQNNVYISSYQMQLQSFATAILVIVHHRISMTLHYTAASLICDIVFSFFLNFRHFCE